MEKYLDKVTQSHILQLQTAMRENRLVVFVGAGVSSSAGSPTWEELIDKIKLELPEEMSNSHDMLKVAQMYRELRGEVEYQKMIKKILKHGQIGFNQIHTAIMNLNPCHIVTTNYDDLLEQSAIQNYKQYYVVAKDEELPKNRGGKMLIKMHGDFNEGNIVLTENDYFDYSRNFPLIRSFVLSLFSTKVVLFVGFSFEDINLKYIIREITSVLGENMQRVYLLADKPKDALSHNYFLKKGIQLLCLRSDIMKDILSTQGIRNIDMFSDNRANSLNLSLHFISMYEPYYGDLIERAIDFFERNNNQIRFWGKYLDRMLPPTKRELFYISDDVLMLPRAFECWFETIVEKKTLKRDVLEKYGAKIKILRNSLVYNKIKFVTTIESRTELQIYGDKTITNPKYKNHTETIDIIYNLDLNKIDCKLKELYKRPLQYTIDDLELPYLLFKLGRYREAYQIYTHLTREMWQHRKYILYFICLYNIKSSFSKLLMQCSNSDEFEKLRDEIASIKLKEVLADLPVASDIREMLEDLENENMLMRDWHKSVKLNTELASLRAKAERGGISIHNKIVSLLDVFDQSFFFCSENYILNECHDFWEESNKMVAEGIINSIMTPENHEWQSKLDGLYSSFAKLFVFILPSDFLKEMLGRLTKGKPIPAKGEFIDSLGRIIHNLNAGIKKNLKLMAPALIVNYLKNIVLILNAIDNACILNLYNPMICYWYEGRFVEFAPELLKLLNRQPPTAKEAAKIIDCILHSKTLSFATGKWIKEYISQLAKIARENGEVLKDFISLEQITSLGDLTLESSFLWAIPERFRDELIYYIREHVNNIYDLCLIEHYTNAHVITPQLIKNLKYKVSNDNMDYEAEACACSNLHMMASQEEYSELSEAVEVFRKVNKCFQFISAPSKYENIDEVKDIWLVCLRDEELMDVLNDDRFGLIVKRLCSEPKNTHFRERILKIQDLL